MKSVRFSNHRYIGDPINAVKLFNDLKADELVFLDIQASKTHQPISVDFIRKVGDEANMPFCVGGGLRVIDDIRTALRAGAERVVLNTAAAEDPEFIRKASEEFGSSTIVVSIDVKKNFLGKEHSYIYSGTRTTGFDPVSFARLAEEKGAGEIIINSIDNDGLMTGYNISLIKRVSEAVRIPVVALGGAGKSSDFKQAIKEGFASAVAAGSMFVYYGQRKAVLINYPSRKEKEVLFFDEDTY